MRMNASDFATRICRDLWRETVSTDRNNFIVTQFHYPDGDLVNLYVEQDGDGILISDRGEAIYKLQVKGLDWKTEPRLEWISSVCTLHGINMTVKNEFTKRIQLNNASVDCLAFCEAITQIATMTYGTNVIDAIQLDEQVSFLVDREVSPTRNIDRNWSSEKADPYHLWPIDYHFRSKRGQENSRNLFVVGSSNRINYVCAAINNLRASKIFIPTMAVIHPDVNMAGKNSGRLESAGVAIIAKGVTGYESVIASFARGEAA